MTPLHTLGSYAALAHAATYAVAREIIWVPDQYERAHVAEAAAFVLAEPGAPSADAQQAAHLLTTDYRWVRWPSK